MECGGPAHGQAHDVRRADVQIVEDGEDIVAGACLRVAGDVRQYIGARPAARVEGDAAVAPGEVAHLRLPTAMVAGKLMDEDDGVPLPASS